MIFASRSVTSSMMILMTICILLTVTHITEAGYRKPPFNGSIFGKRSSGNNLGTNNDYYPIILKLHIYRNDLTIEFENQWYQSGHFWIDSVRKWFRVCWTILRSLQMKLRSSNKYAFVRVCVCLTYNLSNDARTTWAWHILFDWHHCIKSQMFLSKWLFSSDHRWQWKQIYVNQKTTVAPRSLCASGVLHFSVPSYSFQWSIFLFWVTNWLQNQKHVTLFFVNFKKAWFSKSNEPQSFKYRVI